MPHAPNRTEGQALHMIALALRPEWLDNNPGKTWFEKTGGTFHEAENFEHCVDALIAYCKTERDGKKVFKTPSLFHEEGDHWETTRPRTQHSTPRRRCPDHPHDHRDRTQCAGCRSEILAGDRPADKQGISITRTGPAIPAPTKEPQ